MQSLFDESVEKKCAYCANGDETPTGGEILCSIRGIMPLDGCCKKYSYNPLNREPRKLYHQDKPTEEPAE